MAIACQLCKIDYRSYVMKARRDAHLRLNSSTLVTDNKCLAYDMQMTPLLPVNFQSSSITHRKTHRMPRLKLHWWALRVVVVGVIAAHRRHSCSQIIEQSSTFRHQQPQKTKWPTYYLTITRTSKKSTDRLVVLLLHQNVHAILHLLMTPWVSHHQHH